MAVPGHTSLVSTPKSQLSRAGLCRTSSSETAFHHSGKAMNEITTRGCTNPSAIVHFSDVAKG